MTAPAAVARRLVLTGHVQGVGFRPFVYRLAHRHKLDGNVCNRLGEVEIVVQGDSRAVSHSRATCCTPHRRWLRRASCSMSRGASIATCAVS